MISIISILLVYLIVTSRHITKCYIDKVEICITIGTDGTDPREPQRTFFENPKRRAMRIGPALDRDRRSYDLRAADTVAHMVYKRTA